MLMPPIQTNAFENEPYGQEQDSCAIYMSIRKGGDSTFGTLKRSLAALAQMGHRTGFVNGEGDGAGVQTDIPRQLWAKKLSQANLRSSLSTQPGFWVGHLFLPASLDTSVLFDELNARFNDAGLNLLLAQLGRVRSSVLGQSARNNPPIFWQIAGHADTPDLEKRLLKIQTQLEAEYPIHFASLSSHTVVYKLRGSVETLTRFYPDLTDRSYDAAMVLCHARYSTNTVSTFERAQPFPLLGHNGEINTISRFREEAESIGVQLPRNGSDSQYVDRALHSLCVDFGLDLIEAMETIFPPVPHELDLLAPEIRSHYSRMRQAFGPYAQGPAGIIARFGNMAVVSVDALGLRPLWFVDTEKEFIFSSERGAILFDNRCGETRALAPGEKMALIVNRGEGVNVLNHTQIRQHVMMKAVQREAPITFDPLWKDWEGSDPFNPPLPPISEKQFVTPSVATLEVQALPLAGSATAASHSGEMNLPWYSTTGQLTLENRILLACGWQRDHITDLTELLEDGKAPVGSLGYDGPLAALSRVRMNVADYIKETVAVVTNPAIDHQRESEAFSTSTLVGARPEIGLPVKDGDILVELRTPLLTGGHPSLGSSDIAQDAAHEYGSLTIEELVNIFGSRAAFLNLGIFNGETTKSALMRLKKQSIKYIRDGAQCIILDDFEYIQQNLGWIDPHLAVSAVDLALRKEGIRRQAGIVLRSASIRTLHDLALLFGFGADAVNPYALFGVALGAHTNSLPDEQVQLRIQRLLLKSLSGELEKVISTMGCHELRGYGRVSSAIGLSPSVANELLCANFFGSETAGMTWEALDQEAQQRAAAMRGEAASPHLPRVDRFYPKFFKKVSQFARGDISYNDLMNTFRTLSGESPVALRHLIDIRSSARNFAEEAAWEAANQPQDEPGPLMDEVDLTVSGYNLPFVFGAMSFGSQGETSFQAYIQAAAKLNIICVNGEGGELPELMGRYKKNRGQQVASGRFGVNAEFLNSAAVLEIKIGQGAKPGEGGMLPGEKVTPKVALARHTTPFVSLLSPSNNHDLYSIEDLAQLIEELKNVNPEARISVKCPVVPNIGVIAVGIAKAGADIINLSGYDGGTGAARKHALQYVGLPAEIGVIQAHRALVESGIRHRVELWCDGGMKTAEDAFKMILLGANRVGFATMAMVALGCTICRQCNAGTCHVGIATHLRTLDEAKEKGVKGFIPLEYERGVESITRLFYGMGEELRRLAAQLGAKRLQDLVGRADLLEQVRLQEKIDLSSMFVSAPVRPRPEPEPGIGRLVTRPRNSLTRMMSDLVLNILDDDDREVTYQDEVMAFDRALGSYLAGELIRQPLYREKLDRIHLRFGPSSIAGNGFAAWTTDDLDILIEGGAQDGVAKGSSGGRVAVMKGLNHDGFRIDGSVGKSFAYGAQGGTLIVQGDADSRACIRLSGANVIIGGEITSPIDDTQGSIGTHANIKGFACEYMTAGRVVILGDPGPYAFAGMTGGIVYQMLTPSMGFTVDVLRKRIAKGAVVQIDRLERSDAEELRSLLCLYVEALDQTQQHETAQRIRLLSQEHILLSRFVKIVPPTTKGL